MSLNAVRLSSAGRRTPLLAEAIAEPSSPRRQLLVRIAVALAAVALVGGTLVLVAALLPAPSAPTPTRSPFGAGFREAAPSATGWGAYVLALQARFSLMMQDALRAFKTGAAGPWPLIGIGFAYGVFHAAGPGHGKAAISAYLVSGRAGLRRGLALSAGAALVQACVAIALVAGVFVLLRGTAATMNTTALFVERASFLAMAALGALLVWRKAGALVAGEGATAECACGPECGHDPFGAGVRASRSGLREMAAVAVSAGIRPCAGAILLFVFAISQGMALAGAAAVFAMAAGTAITTGAIATVTVSAKALAIRVLGGGGGGGWRFLAGAELLAAAFVLVLGATLLIGLWKGEGAI